MGTDLTIHWYKVLDSTNRIAKEQALTASDQTVWAAEVQTHGRGQRGNTWSSDAGKNLTFSWLVKPANLSPLRQFCISQVAALGVCDYLEQWGIPAKIKWPNDIYVGDRKICGILIEHSLTSERIQYSVIGIGLNLLQTQFPVELPNPTSMALELPLQFTPETVTVQDELPRLLSSLLKVYACLDVSEEGGGEQLLEELYLRKLYRLQETAQFIDKTQSPHREFSGRILGLDHRSCLRIYDEDLQQERIFAFQEVGYCI
ncbi:MAG: biotin--[Bacteroidales bacterium]|nr:biotin--[acetyl-CoA-carboxylase] ligase [Bacteroidales bacterium]